MSLLAAVFLVGLGGLAPASPASASEDQRPPLQLVVTPFVTGLEFPVFVTHAADGTGRLYVAEKAGRVLAVSLDGTVQAVPLLDISDRVMLEHSEQGLLGLAFHPDFVTNGRMYVDYTRLPDGATVISEFIVDGDSANPDTERPVIIVPQPGREHNAGMITFDRAGRLLASLGDGSYYPAHRADAQDPDVMLGKIIAIDVDSTATYMLDTQAKPEAGTPRPEVIAQGLRNPWRFSVDRELGHIYVGDVGLSSWEEINVVPAGSEPLDFGWDQLEGPQCGPDSNCSPGAFIPPAIAYAHDPHGSVIGGYAYRGESQPMLEGLYLFGDFSYGRVYAAPVEAMLEGAAEPVVLAAGVPGGVVSFGEDEDGELYVVGLESIARISAAPADPEAGIAVQPIEAIPAGSVVFEILYSNALSIREGPDGCTTVRPTGADPFLGFAVPADSTLFVEPGSEGTLQVFLESEGLVSEGQSIRIKGSAAPYKITTAASSPDESTVVRVDPPSRGSTVLCLVPDSS